MRIGIDVGGTNTDAVLMDGRRLVAWAKRPTTRPVETGIMAALSAVIADSGIASTDVRIVMIGTTHFTNAFVEARGLLHVGVIRLASPSGEALPPMIGWPGPLREAVEGRTFMLPGGYEFDGREIAPFDGARVREAARQLRRQDLRAIAISSAFAPVNSGMEERAAAIVREEFPTASITLSSSIGRVGLLERENAAIMNASLASLASEVVVSFREALQRLGIKAPFFVTQNDGTLMSADCAERLPILTFGSGPTNSIRGAAFLTGRRDAIVIDIGGTTSDIGVLAKGFPRESSLSADIGGVRTNFRMPDVLAIGLGGGTRVHLPSRLFDAAGLSDCDFAIGPDSVGLRLPQDAYLFGGETLTMSDVAVAAGFADFGDRQRVPSLSQPVRDAILARARLMIESGIDRMKTASGDVPVVVVGGGAFLLQETPRGASTLERPEHASVANAIGAAIAQVGGEVDRVCSYAAGGRETALAEVRAEAVRVAAAAGAAPATIEIIDMDEVALNYLPGETVRVRARAVGNLEFI
ncbi:MAG TPA: hydantoinase/oxoprolinase family protein [Steroidobacter sp.]|uniref:hydantoinase/oxoprolinase family protein n=1 Tax=Steroidobacter sp. TaxID=1978227 RepID=UPI002EDA5CF0